MKLTELTRKIASLHKVAKKRSKETSDAALRTWLTGYQAGLDEVTDMIKREHEIERTEQRLARLKNDQAQEPQPDWSRAEEETAKATPTPVSRADNALLNRIGGTQEAA